MSYLVFHRSEHGQGSGLKRIKYLVPSFCVLELPPKEHVKDFYFQCKLKENSFEDALSEWMDVLAAV